ncbi:penicillin acylase family protein [Marinobacter adhaerens]|uniref:Penicillin acylase family protein n=1 Tax=Marinobacter adhaerens TaxID=1033846 RepID=A0A851HY99_9GAMM|nr:penicillin acylase family protein [Marinobacter adhaerens]NWN92242.1 penicillin acylase family protein [Marinobacter adhaerens]
MQTWKKQAVRTSRGLALVLLSGTVLTGCFDGSSSSSGSSKPELNTNLFPADGKLEANIRRTEGGVPHIKADNLKSAAFGHGYAQAQDNVCLLAEAVVKARSERAKYFGPGPDSINIINDFSYKAQKILSGAEREYGALTDESKALIDGFTAGYNRYVTETDAGDYPQRCSNQPWVKEIAPTDLLAHYRIVGQYASGGELATGAVFLAIPGEDPVAAEPDPVIADTNALELEKVSSNARALAAANTNLQETGLGSNAWGLGKEMTEQGRGALLANPHFPYTGHRRLYQAQITVPGYLNVNGAGLLGTALPLISFNENLAWSHTVSTSRRFTVYELQLKSGDDLTYIKDGEEKPITQETYQIEVATGGPSPMLVERTFYFSEYGPMLSANAVTRGGLPKWGESGTAYTYRDANANTGNLLDTWLGMSRASNLEEFQDVFRNCGTTLWVNSTYADAEGNAFYIDSSSAPNLSEKTIALINFKRSVSPEYAQLFDNGITLLDGSHSYDDWVEGKCGGLTTYDQKPKLVRTDWVQNSNSSYWATNPAEFLTGYSPIYGDEDRQVNPRTRLGIKMLQNPTDSGMPGVTPPAGAQSEKFNAKDLIGVIWNNRAWYAEQFLPELVERCDMVGSDPVEGEDLSEACGVLTNWDGVYNRNSVGAHVFRVFIANYADSFDTDLTVPFTRDDIVNTPSGPSSEGKGTETDAMLVALARGVKALNAQSIGLSEALGDVQYIRPSGDVPPNGTPLFQTPPIPWHGGDGNVDGAFNAIGVVTDKYAVDTRFPRIAPDVVPKTGGLSDGTVPGTEGWLIARGTSWHFGLEFTDNGPEAYGLVSYGQSADSQSDYFLEQSKDYSDKDYRQLWFTEEDIQLHSNGEQVVKAEM